MKKLLVAALVASASVIGFGSGLSGCGAIGTIIDTKPLPVSQSLPPVAQLAQQAVNEANGWLASVAIIAKQDQDAGFISQAKALEYKAEFQQQAKALDKLQGLIDTCAKDATQCNILGDAESRAKLITKAMQSLRKQLAERRTR